MRVYLLINTICDPLCVVEELKGGEWPRKRPVYRNVREGAGSVDKYRKSDEQPQAQDKQYNNGGRGPQVVAVDTHKPLIEGEGNHIE